MSSPAVLIATARIRPGSEDAFAAWKGRHDAAIAAFAGFNSSDIMPPGAHDDTWTHGGNPASARRSWRNSFR